MSPWLSVILAASFSADRAAARLEIVAPARIEVALKWRYKRLKGRMEVYDLAQGSQWPLWKMGTVGSQAELPLGREIRGTVKLEAGEERMLVLVFRPAKGDGARFFAAPHAMTPAERALGCEFWCLCVNDVYNVPPGRLWYRVVRLGLKNPAVGGRIDLTHVLIGVP